MKRTLCHLRSIGKMENVSKCSIRYKPTRSISCKRVSTRHQRSLAMQFKKVSLCYRTMLLSKAENSSKPTLYLTFFPSIAETRVFTVTEMDPLFLLLPFFINENNKKSVVSPSKCRVTSIDVDSITTEKKPALTTTGSTFQTLDQVVDQIINES